MVENNFGKSDEEHLCLPKGLREGSRHGLSDVDSGIFPEKFLNNVGTGKKPQTPMVESNVEKSDGEHFSLPEGLREGSRHGLSAVGSGICSGKFLNNVGTDRRPQTLMVESNFDKSDEEQFSLPQFSREFLEDDVQRKSPRDKLSGVDSRHKFRISGGDNSLFDQGRHSEYPSSTQARGEPRAAPKEKMGDDITTSTVSPAQNFSIWFVNARSVNNMERREIIAHYLDEHRPDIFGIVETWLDEFSCKHIVFRNYTLVHRRDRPGARPSHANHGGIILFRRILHSPLVTFLEESPVAERIWARVETNLGPFLLGLWYRPPNAGDDHVISLETEFEHLIGDYVGAVLLGDFNVHQRRWLRFSNGNTALGERVQNFASKHGLKQCVKSATHVDGNLLDLVLSSLPFATTCSITPRIADHNGVLTEINVPVITESVHEREVWDFKKADWSKLQQMLEAHDWSFLERPDHANLEEHSCFVDFAASTLVRDILVVCRECIPTRISREMRKSHPWMTQRCVNALAEKASLENTSGYDDACRRCGDIIRREFSEHVGKLKAKLQELPRASKEWWRMSNELLDNVVPRMGVPSLRDANGEWIHDGLARRISLSTASLRSPSCHQKLRTSMFVSPSRS